MHIYNQIERLSEKYFRAPIAIMGNFRSPQTCLSQIKLESCGSLNERQRET